jgi:hypothetical protein
MPLTTPVASGRSSPDGRAYDVVTLVSELQAAVDGMGALALAVPDSAIADNAAATAAVVAGLIPAGGTGSADGGWDTAAHRDTAIATVGELKTTVNALVTDVAAIRTKVNTILAALRTVGLISE